MGSGKGHARSVGGTDRFIAWPYHPERPACWCRRCGGRWDAIALVQALHGIDFKEACDFLARHAGIAQASVTTTVAPAKPAANDNQDYAEKIWRESTPVEATIGETYLRSRSITIPLPPSIRFAPRLWHSLAQAEFPALVSAITPIDGSIIQAILRTYVDPNGHGKANIDPSRMMLGQAASGSVHLADAAETMAVCEGLESGLSMMQVSGASPPGLR